MEKVAKGRRQYGILVFTKKARPSETEKVEKIPKRCPQDAQDDAKDQRWKAPTVEAARKAHTKIKDILHPRRDNRKGHKDPKLNLLLRSWLEGMQRFLKLLSLQSADGGMHGAFENGPVHLSKRMRTSHSMCMAPAINWKVYLRDGPGSIHGPPGCSKVSRLEKRHIRAYCKILAQSHGF